MTNRLHTALVLASSASSASAALVVFDYNPSSPLSSSDPNGQSAHVSQIDIGAGTFSKEPGLPSFILTALLFSSNTYDYETGSLIGSTYTPRFKAESPGEINFKLVEGRLYATPANPFTISSVNFSPSGFFLYESDLQSVGTFYLGLSLTVQGLNHFGWIEIERSDDLANPGFSLYNLNRFALESVAGQSVTTPTAIPEASTLGLVGGIFGLVAAAHVRRRKLKQAAASDKFLALAAGEKLN